MHEGTVCVCVCVSCLLTGYGSVHGGAWWISLLLVVLGKYKPLMGEIVFQSRTIKCVEVMAFGKFKDFSGTVLIRILWLKFWLPLGKVSCLHAYLWVYVLTLPPSPKRGRGSRWEMLCCWKVVLKPVSSLKDINECGFECHKCKIILSLLASLGRLH